MRYLSNVYFRAHTMSLILSIVLAFILSPIIIVLFAILQKAHMYFYNGCLLTSHQRFFGSMHGKYYMQDAAKRFFNREISTTSATKVENTIRNFIVLVVIARIALLPFL